MSNQPSSTSHRQLDEISKAPVTNKIGQRLLSWEVVRDTIFLIAAIVAIVGLVIWLFESNKRHEERLLRKLQLASNGLEVISKVQQSEVDKNLVMPSPAQIGLAITAISYSVEDIHIPVKFLNADCGGNIVSSSVTFEGTNVRLSSCQFPGKGEISFSKKDSGLSVEFNDVLVGFRRISMSNKTGSINFINSRLAFSTIVFHGTKNAFIRFHKTNVENVSIP